MTQMTREEIGSLVGRLREFNEWRRDGEGEMPDPRQIGIDLDRAADLLERMGELSRRHPQEPPPPVQE